MYIYRKHKLQPCLAISIHSIVEACFNTKVKVYSHAVKTNKALVDPAGRKMVRQYWHRALGHWVFLLPMSVCRQGARRQVHTMGSAYNGKCLVPNYIHSCKLHTRNLTCTVGVTQYTFSAEQLESVLMSSAAPVENGGRKFWNWKSQNLL